MLKDISIGIDKDGDNKLINIERDNIRNQLLIGATASGKSIYHYNFYSQVMENQSPDEVGFIFIDYTRFDFTHVRESPYLLKPVIVEVIDAEKLLNQIIDKEVIFNKYVFIHIEENIYDEEDYQKFVEIIRKLKSIDNLFLTFSTSRPYESLFNNLNEYLDIKMVFNLVSESDYKLFLNTDHDKYPMGRGSRIAVVNNEEYELKPNVGEDKSSYDRFNSLISNL